MTLVGCNSISKGKWYKITNPTGYSHGDPIWCRSYEIKNGCITYYGYSEPNDNFGYGTTTICGTYQIKTYYYD